MSEPVSGRKRPIPVWWVLVAILLLLGWLLSAPYLAFAALITSAPFFGEQPTAAEVADAHRLLLGSVAVAVGVPLVGLVPAVGLRLGLRWLFVIMLVIGAVFAALVGVDLYWNERR